MAAGISRAVAGEEALLGAGFLRRLTYASICHMKRTTIFLDEAAERELDFLAQRRGEPKATLVREAIGEYLVRRRDAPGTALAFVGIGRSGRSDIADRHEELLFREPPAEAATGNVKAGNSSPATRARRRRSGPR